MAFDAKEPVRNALKNAAQSPSESFRSDEDDVNSDGGLPGLRVSPPRRDRHVGAYSELGHGNLAIGLGGDRLGDDVKSPTGAIGGVTPRTESARQCKPGVKQSVATRQDVTSTCGGRAGVAARRAPACARRKAARLGGRGAVSGHSHSSQQKRGESVH
jgi:hypothetical protein